MFGVVDFDAVAFEFCFVDGAVVAVAREAVEGVHDDGSEAAAFTVTDKALKFGAFVCFAGEGTVAVFADDGEVVFGGEFVAFTKLPFDGFFTLHMAGISCIDNGFHKK